MRRYSGRFSRARRVIASASAVLVWSFQSQHCALGSSRKRGSSASGTLAASTGIGQEPVASTPMPTTCPGSNPGVSPARRSAPFTAASSPTR